MKQLLRLRALALLLALALCLSVPLSVAAAPTSVSVTVSVRGLDAAGEPDDWISDLQVNLLPGSTAWDAIDLALSTRGYVPVRDGGYLTGVRTPDDRLLSQMTGDYPFSGWLYRVNGLMPSVAMEGYLLSSGQQILLFFTKDFNEDYASITAPVFTDTKGLWMDEAVTEMAKLGVVQGIGSNLYAPSDTMTIEQFTLLLSRLPTPYPITLVPQLDTPLTREAAFGFLYSTAIHNGFYLPSDTANSALFSYPDAALLSPNNRASTAALIEAGLIQGSDSLLHPARIVTRAEGAQMAYNFYLFTLNQTAAP